MPISKLSRKRCKVVDRTMTNHTLKLIRLMKTVAMDICYKDKYSKPIQTHRDKNAVYQFMGKMQEKVEFCKSIVEKRFNKPLKMTENDELCFKLMDKCHICNKKYTDKDVRVGDHCHITGKFRSSAYQECNLKLRIKPENINIPVIFHNLRGCDSHFIMQQIGEIAKNHAYINKKGESTA